MKKVRDIMTRSPACADATTPVPDIARMMVENDCGEIPVLDADGAPIGVVTDRDIVVRAIARDRSPMDLSARDVMSTPCVTVRDADDVRECLDVLEAHMIRRVPVVDAQGRCCGIVSQADLARQTDEHATAELLKEVSRPVSSTAAFI